MEVQQKKDVAQKALEEFKSSNNRFMATVNKKVTQGKEQHESHSGGVLLLTFITYSTCTFVTYFTCTFITYFTCILITYFICDYLTCL